MLNYKSVFKGGVILCLIIPTVSYAKDKSKEGSVNDNKVVEAIKNLPTIDKEKKMSKKKS